MRKILKTDFEKYIISLATKVGSKYKFVIGGKDVWIWFEGQTIVPSDNFINLAIIPVNTSRMAMGCKKHDGLYRFYIYALTVQMCDEIADYLAGLFDDKRIEVTAGTLIDTDVLNVTQRGNRFEDSTHYESIADLAFANWTS